MGDIPPLGCLPLCSSRPRPPPPPRSAPPGAGFSSGLYFPGPPPPSGLRSSAHAEVGGWGSPRPATPARPRPPRSPAAAARRRLCLGPERRCRFLRPLLDHRRPCGGPWRPGLAFVPRPKVPSGRLSGCGERGWGLRINPAPSGEREKPRGQGVKQRQRGRSAEGKAERRWREDSEAWPGHSAEQSRAEPGRAGDSGRLRGPAGLQPRSPLRHRAGGYLPYTARWERP